MHSEGRAAPDAPVFRSRKGEGLLDESAVHPVVKAAISRGPGRAHPPGASHILEHAPEPALRGQDPQPEPMPRARDAEREVPHARRSLTRRTQG
jgi:hypothetical protein